MLVSENDCEGRIYCRISTQRRGVADIMHKEAARSCQKKMEGTAYGNGDQWKLWQLQYGL